MLFFTFFQQLAEKKAPVTVELKNDLLISGLLQSVDRFLNIKLNDITVASPEKNPHLLSVRNVFIRGSVVRYIHLPSRDVNVADLTSLCRKSLEKQKRS